MKNPRRRKKKLTARQRVLYVIAITLLSPLIVVMFFVRRYGVVTLLGWSIAIGVVGGMAMSIYYHAQGETGGQLYPIMRGEGRQWFWLRFAGVSLGIGAIWAVVRWLHNPVVYPEAAKGYYMGQSLNNQRQMRDTLGDIRDRLEE